MSVSVRPFFQRAQVDQELRLPMWFDIFIGRLVSFVLIGVCGAVVVGIVKLIKYLDREDK